MTDRSDLLPKNWTVGYTGDTLDSLDILDSVATEPTTLDAIKALYQ